jgi:PAT family beta-lactamase induction signal transducer AmpG
MLFLGFSSGLPFYLVYQSLSAWLRQDGIQRSTIGMLAWVGFAYSFKFLWAPIVDRLPLPFLHAWLGRRRSWMLLAQIGLAIGIFNLSLSEPNVSILRIASWALFTAFCAATQDISIDAWRIESSGSAQQGTMAAAYQIGYRGALIVSGAGALSLAQHFSWPASYAVMAVLVGVGIATTLLAREPQVTAHRVEIESEERVIAWVKARPHWPQWARTAGSVLVGAVVCPFLDFLARYRFGLAILLLGFMGTYRLTEFTMGSMANPFYIDQGYTLDQIASVIKTFGLSMSVVGIVLAGIVIAKVGLLRALVLGSLMIMTSNIGFAILASIHVPTLVGIAIVNSIDNLAQAMHGTALIAFLSSLTSQKYTATQYALFSSLYALPGKILEGTSGFVVDAIGYPRFFLYTASLSIPALLLLYFIARRPTIREELAATSR